MACAWKNIDEMLLTNAPRPARENKRQVTESQSGDRASEGIARLQNWKTLRGASRRKSTAHLTDDIVPALKPRDRNRKRCTTVLSVNSVFMLLTMGKHKSCNHNFITATSLRHPVYYLGGTWVHANLRSSDSSVSLWFSRSPPSL